MDEWYSLPGFNQPMACMSHLVGALVFFVLGILMIRSAWSDRKRFWCCGIFAFAVVLLLSLSGVFHMFRPKTTPREVMVRLDVAAIFVLIAASFTPVHGVLYRGWNRWGILIPLWLFTVTAITLRTIFFSSLPYIWGNGIFLLMGWIGLYSTVLTYRDYGKRIAVPVIAGGICYTIGVVGDSFQWPTIIPRVWGSHETFHWLVLAGISWHWYLMSQIAEGRMTYEDRKSTSEPR